MKKARVLLISLLILCLAAVSFLGGCGKESSTSSGGGGGRTTSNDPKLPSADGKATESSKDGKVQLDYSNISEGYFLIKYTGDADILQIRITTPSGEIYPYPMVAKDSWKAFSLTDGDGKYMINVMEHVSGDNYAVSLSLENDVKLTDEMEPFLYPNQYVDYDADTKSVSLGREISDESSDDIDFINNVYSYVTKEIKYDNDKASDLPVNYIPDIEETLKTGKGICFDYAAVMTSMLRSQNIPARLEVGYAGTVYHAWISVYLEDSGWVDNIIEFDGEDWTLMDPTLRSSGKDSYEEQMESGEEYNVKYHY